MSVSLALRSDIYGIIRPCSSELVKARVDNALRSNFVFAMWSTGLESPWLWAKVLVDLIFIISSGCCNCDISLAKSSSDISYEGKKVRSSQSSSFFRCTWSSELFAISWNLIVESWRWLLTYIFWFFHWYVNSQCCLFPLYRCCVHMKINATSVNWYCKEWLQCIHFLRFVISYLNDYIFPHL